MGKKMKHTEVFQPFNIIVFGGDGDLAFRKIYPALFHRNQDGQFLCPYNIVSITRRDPNELNFNSQLVHFLNESKEKETSTQDIHTFAEKVKLIQIVDASPENFSELVDYLTGFSEYQNIYYFSTPSTAFGPIAKTLKKVGLIRESSKVVLEKPLGYSLESSYEINKEICVISS